MTNYVPPQKTKIKGVLGVETRKIKQPINEFLLKINGKKRERMFFHLLNQLAKHSASTGRNHHINKFRSNIFHNFFK